MLEASFSAGFFRFIVAKILLSLQPLIQGNSEIEKSPNNIALSKFNELNGRRERRTSGSQ